MNFLTWIAGYLVIAAVLVALEVTAGHNQWTVWSYITFGYIIAWVAASIFGLVKGWFY